ncbi:hypothetical protein ILUMI_16078 [Ignelater luminosus]|uniref:PiggyBac transposable element-derived protein domain-containing protein n=1 Tax=Ignelater luminosus TaxID=2038154 RepID=A0A8K0CV51_IGNLU|nr:hypothetical protein ILUMI_16078 [Ignelater luminosus]
MFRLFFDNIFTGIDLLPDLKNINIEASGTIRDNCVDKSCTLIDLKQMKKTVRGTWECATDDNTEISIIKWDDNNIVSIATNFDQVQPVKDVARFSREARKKITIQ